MSGAAEIRWVATTPSEAWRHMSDVAIVDGTTRPDVTLRPASTRQTIEGFGAAFSEMSWLALGALSPADRTAVLAELFAPGIGAQFTICRTPIGGNDLSTEWYSYDETPGDFALDEFTVEHDDATLVPFIRAALVHQPALRVWASPWCPPTWMKVNGHYASARPQPWQHEIANGLRADQVIAEGTDGFIQDDRHLDAYARYFGRFIDAYRERGIDIGMVMPQNEFNSDQIFPSCTWTPASLARFVARLLAEMRPRDVAVYAGTLERSRPDLLEPVLDVLGPDAGIGLQWAGKGSIEVLRYQHPSRPILQSEQECGDGENDWRFAGYAWGLLRRFLNGGANVYQYWNIALHPGGRSRWGWPQNSLITVAPDGGSYRFNPDYWVLKHVSHFVRPGAKVIDTFSLNGWDDLVAFVNPDGAVVLAVHNAQPVQAPFKVELGTRTYAMTLPAESYSTLTFGG